MFRKLIFALVLVAAAFAGGVAINGPGLAWLQRTFVGGPSIIVDGDPSSPAIPRPPKPFPTAKTPALQVDLKKFEASKKPLAPPADPIAELPPDPSPPAVALLQVADPSTRAPSPVVEAMPPLELPPDPGPAPAKADPVARLASASTSTEPPAATPPKEWAEIRKRMKDLGIARYAIEAEVDGRVKFSCVIPVEGLRAVGHHFEAEGDDEAQAVEAGLKRVALWRATESK